MTTAAATRHPLRPVEFSPLIFTGIAALVMLIPDIAHKDLIGVGASVLAFAVFIPQAWRVWRMRNDHHALQGVSVMTNMFIVNNSLVWGIYAYTVGEFWVGAAGIINLPLASMIIAVIIRSRFVLRRRADRSTSETSPSRSSP